jgi:AraC-like DNA-binding protein
MSTVFMPSNLRPEAKTIYDVASGMHSRSSGTDPLAVLVGLLEPEGVVSKIMSGAGRWSVRYAAHEQPGFAIVLEGSCFLDVQGAPPVELREGDFVLLPASPPFVMSSDRALKPTPVTSVNDDIRHGTKTGPPTLRMLGGYFRFDRANAQLLLRFLPVMVHIRRGEPGSTRLRRIVELISEETNERRPGRDLIVERLVEVLLVEALRFRPAASARQEQGLLAGLADPALARALRRIHEDVAHRWTVAELARTSGMSRAVFAERFTRTVGLPPMQYVLEWRIAIAKDVLVRERAPLAEVAEMIGYQSASAFSVAFTRHAGCSPSAFARSGGS